MGGDSIEMQQPQMPTAPTTAFNMDDYIKNYPKMMELQQEYNPQSAALAFDIASKYAPSYAGLQQQISEQTSPETAALQENLAAIANEGMNAGVPQAMQDAYRSELRANVGPNVGSGIAGDYISRNMINQGEDYRKYYQNLGLSLANRQPLPQYQNPAYSDAGAGYNYGTVAQGNQSNYATASGLYGNLYTQNMQQSQANKMFPYQAAGTAAGAVGGLLWG